MRKLELSNRLTSDIAEVLASAGQDLKELMEIGRIDHMKISLDLNFNTTGKFMGVQYTAFKFEQAEVIYDTDLKGA